MLEISKLLKIGYRPAYNHISELEGDNVIVTKKVGSSKQCFLNLENAQSRHFLQEVDLVRKKEVYRSSLKLRTILEEIVPKIINQIVASLHSVSKTNVPRLSHRSLWLTSQQAAGHYASVNSTSFNCSSFRPCFLM